MRKIALALIVLVVVLAVALTLLPTPIPPGYGEPDIGGNFTLTDTQGKRMHVHDFKGRWMLVYLGYTHCPDICPATLSVLSDTLKKLGEDAGKVAVVFITLDAEHDSPEALGAYLRNFDPRITGLTGSEEEIREVVHAYKAYAAATPNAGPGNMLISHSGQLYLMDPQGKYKEHFDNGVTSDALTAALKKHF